MNKFEENKNAIVDILTSLSDSSVRERQEKHAGLIATLKEMKSQDENGFWDALEFGQYEFLNVICDVINVPSQKNAGIIEYIVSGLYEHFLEELMKKVEGFTCCADKSRFIKRKTLEALLKERNLSLFEDYSKYDQITENKEKQAYWSPVSIPDTDTAMNIFWDWYLLRESGSEEKHV